MKNNEDFMPWEKWLIILGTRSVDYAYIPEMIFEHIEYFKNCYKNGLSCYKALEWFSFEFDKKNINEQT